MAILFYFWLRWVFVAVHGVSLVAASRGYSSLWCMGFSLWWLLLLWSMGPRCMGSVDTSRTLLTRSGRASLMVQWVRIHTPNAGGLGSSPGQGTRSHMHAAIKRSCVPQLRDTACRN